MIVRDIKQAKFSIKLAIFNLTSKKISSALIDAKNRGLDVKVITESSNLESSGFKELKSANIAVLEDGVSYSLMHNKFMVIDNRLLWSGSANYSDFSFYRNWENFIRVEKDDIATLYSNEFDEIVSNLKEVDVYNKSGLEVYFSPDDNFKSRVLELINSATSSIKILAYSFTDKDIANALIDAKDRGVKVKVIVDGKWSDNVYSKDEYLQDYGVDLKRFYSSSILHDKVIIVDKNITVTGSYNFTESANSRNRENSIIVHNSLAAKLYIEEFNKIYAKSR